MRARAERRSDRHADIKVWIDLVGEIARGDISELGDVAGILGAVDAKQHRRCPDTGRDDFMTKQERRMGFHPEAVRIRHRRRVPEHRREAHARRALSREGHALSRRRLFVNADAARQRSLRECKPAQCHARKQDFANSSPCHFIPPARASRAQLLFKEIVQRLEVLRNREDYGWKPPPGQLCVLPSSISSMFSLACRAVKNPALQATFFSPRKKSGL